MHSKDSAFPIVVPDYPVELNPPKVDLGMNLRTYIATACLNAILNGINDPDENWCALTAVKCADALIARLNKKEAK